MTKTMLS